jgi:metal-responsive CopG/Arc/MetJ family transcriptional regulator
MSVSVPHPMLEKIEKRAEEKGYKKRSEYVRSLIRDDIEQDDETNIVLAEDGNGDMNEKGAA